MQPKTFNQALSEMARHLMAELPDTPDLVPGSVLRSLLEAVAFQVEDLGYRQERSILDATPEAIYQAFAHARLPATSAAGVLRFFCGPPAAAPVLVPTGTEVYGEGEALYVTTADAVISVGSLSVDAPAQAQATGSRTNAAAGSITRLGSGILGVQSVLNPASFAGGRDAEEPSDQADRFQAYLASLDRSNLAALRVVVLGTEYQGQRLNTARLSDANTDPAIDPGHFTVRVYKRGGVGADLLSALKVEIDTHRSGGCLPTLSEVTGQPINVRAVLTVRQLGTLASARAAVEAYFAALDMGQKVSIENLIAALSTAHPDILEVTILTPTSDVRISPGEQLELGALDLTEQQDTPLSTLPLGGQGWAR